MSFAILITGNWRDFTLMIIYHQNFNDKMYIKHSIT